jgi:hypothetical protein
MPNVEVNTPVSSAASVRLVLGVGWVRPAAGSIGGTLHPAIVGSSARVRVFCFEGTEE